MGAYFLVQMARYTSYHRDRRNKATHFIGVPAIAVSLLLPLALVRIGTAGWYEISLATVLAAAAWLFWIAMDRPFGIAASIAFLPALFFAAWLAARGAEAVWFCFAALFAGGWGLQLVGHAFEGRKPALLDNFMQICIAPIFLIAEVAFALGLRESLAAEVEARWRDYLPESGNSEAAHPA